MANEKRLIEVKTAWKKAQRIYSDLVILHCIKNVLDETPTVDAAPVVYGEWIEGYAWNIVREKIECYTLLCSECDNTFKTKTEEEREYWKKRFKVCPFCGAIMDGGRRTNEPEEPV